MELRAYLAYRHIHAPLTYWRSTSQFEVDFILGTKVAIEVKATNMVHERMLKGLKALSEEKMIKNFIVISLDPRPRKLDNIEILPWKEFLDQLWQGRWI